jgi:DNA-binding transcriptional ArsR family regulator
MAPEFVQILKALSDETRFGIVKLLLSRDLCVGALAHHLGISEAAVSQHLKLLREAGLVKGEKRGYWTHYMVERNKLNELAELLTELTKPIPHSKEVCIENVTTKSTAKRGEQKCVNANVSTRKS